MTEIVEIDRGTSPVILAFPHSGTAVPPGIWDGLNDNGRILSDTDWHLPRLYDGLLPGATCVRGRHHRYVIDLNRDPAGASLYPGQNTTALVPLTDFDGVPIWSPGSEPDEAEIVRRREAFHAPYHAALAAEIERIRDLHGLAVVYDCHSIRSRIPFLFEGTLPDLNIGTDFGRTCAPPIETAALDAAGTAAGFTHVLNGRFRGGWTTRHYGRPEANVHAIQMELAQSTHLATETTPFAYDAEKADRLRAVLRAVLERIEQAALSLPNKRTT
ncbi:MAG: N-formylglutamate deformylase [Rhizobiales bacterium]|nr:N-formylglutamate deformylase [Hyphomicrobiales bacterium]